LAARITAAILLAHETLVDAFGHQGMGDFLEEFFVEPGHQPPHLDALGRRFRHQPLVAHCGTMGLVDIFGDDGGAWNRRKSLGRQHRGRARRIKRQEGLAPLPAALFHQLKVEPVFADDQANKARMRAERMMKQREHEDFDYLEVLNNPSIFVRRHTSSPGPGGNPRFRI
jgi:hypothetical protein